MTKYKIVTSDLDGTLLDSNASVSEENLVAIRALSERGVLFVPSTGRTFSEIPEELRNNSDIRYYIHSNGATVYDKQTGKRITSCISNEIGSKVIEVFEKYKVHKTYRQGGKCYVDSAYQTEEMWDKFNVCIPHRVVVDAFSVYLDNFDEEMKAADEVEVYSIFFEELSEKSQCRAELLEIEEIAIAEVSEHNIEIFSKSAGKGKALYALADMLGVPYDETMSLGDSDNDRSITLAAGLGLATENACDSLKEIADEIICSNDEHVAEFVFKKYF